MNALILAQAADAAQNAPETGGDTIINLAYIVACVLFIFGIKRLGKTETARSGNMISSLGMLIAVIAVFFQKNVLQSWTTDWFMNGYLWCFGGIIIGAIIGAIWAKKVKMTGMPELVALFNGFGGLASLLVAWSEYEKLDAAGNWLPHVESVSTFSTAFVNELSLYLTVLIGSITFTGSLLAYCKLSEKISGRPFLFKGQQFINAIIVLVIIAGLIIYLFPGIIAGQDPASVQTVAIYAAIIVSLLMGITVVLPIGGGDMPVVISMLNSLSGLAAAMAGFIINNNVLVVAGCLVGASGVILTVIMCKAMNRSVGNLLFSGFGAATSGSAKKAGTGAEPKAVSVEDAYLVLEAARSVVFVPGYGMAVAQAQHVVKELATKLEANGAEVSFAIHPVAGRMPGHMNVLLAEADVPYEQLKTMDEINPLMPMQDVAIVIGANDVVNPAAASDKSSPIYGMPIIKASEARTVFVLKRGKGKGFSGIENELFTKENTRMIYGDAKSTVSALVAEFGKD
ncbi:MAG: NAD(P)(+) transhydrogenase (Re/Si-specific) subunit beta [Opitutae bacterium]|nr:NAD(P)(+) transhydrogenase (Re/Si-specific) subunit beta [Opitutae bacterium]